MIGIVPEVSRKNTFILNLTEQELGKTVLKVKLKTNLRTMLPITLSYNITPIDTHYGTVYAALVILGLYILIIFEVSMFSSRRNISNSSLNYINLNYLIKYKDNSIIVE